MDAEVTIHALATCKAHPVVTWLSSSRDALLYVSCAEQYSDHKRGSLPALMLLDIQTAGVKLVERIKRDRFTVCTPIVVLGSREDAVMIRKCLEYGANSYIIKPITAAAYFQTIAAVGDYWLEFNAHDFNVAA
jgi:DNA-binding response OmpR family regulator